MARYRKIDVRIWGDEKFSSLSRLEPSGQGLFLYLLTNPNTNSIPGLFRAGEAQLAEELGWPMEGFREAFGEASSKGIVKADWKARLIWIPNAFRYNKPESPNVVTSWSVSWDELPECGLKVIAYEALKAFAEGLGGGFAKAFDKACPKPMANQEQEQEQEQEEKQASPPEPPPVSEKPKGRKKAVEERYDPLTYPIPLLLDTPEFRSKWAEFCTYREKVKKKPFRSDHGPRDAFKHLSPLGPEAAIEALELTMAKGWDGPEHGVRELASRKAPARGGGGYRPAATPMPPAGADKKKRLERAVEDVFEKAYGLLHDGKLTKEQCQSIVDAAGAATELEDLQRIVWPANV